MLIQLLERIKQGLYYYSKIDFKIDKIIIASEVNHRDGIGVQIFSKNKLILKIFRNDKEKTRTITTYIKYVPLEFIEESINQFKTEIPWDFID